MPDGQQQQRTQGVTQGGVISPLLANLFLHYAFDIWMHRNYSHVSFERYADDIIVHCRTETEAQKLKGLIQSRLKICKLELHTTKTKIAYCRDANREKKFFHYHFDFLGFTFQPRLVRSKTGEFFASFTPAISKRSANAIRQTMRGWKLQLKCNRTIQEISNWINPVIRGWINYYGAFRRSALNPIFSLLNVRLMKWAKWKYKKLKGHSRGAMHWMGRIAHKNPKLFAHWVLGFHPGTGQ